MAALGTACTTTSAIESNAILDLLNILIFITPWRNAIPLI
jgi:hypothetical protein